MNRDVVVVSAVRTPIGGFGGSLREVPPTQLASHCVRAAIQQVGIDPSRVGHVVFGNVIHTDARDHYLARVAALDGGLPETTPALTVNRLCGSGLQAILTAAHSIMLGETDIAVAGGAENMSRSPYHVPSARWGSRMGDTDLVDMMVGALSDPFSSCHMGITAENLARKYSITRHDQDELAVESHARAGRALKQGHFVDQVIPIDTNLDGTSVLFTHDETVRMDATLEKLSSLRPAFKPDGTVTAGNSSNINDAAASIVLMDGKLAEKEGIAPLGRLVNYSYAGVDPAFMGIGPVPAIRQLLRKTGLSLDQIDLFELNEAFAAQAIAVCRELDLPTERINPNGSGISLGHPIGATGTILTVKALHELKRTKSKHALVAMCIGGGQGIASLFERLD